VAAQAIRPRGRAIDGHHLAKLMARDFGDDETGRSELRRIYAGAEGPLAQIVEQALVASIDEEGLLALVRRFAAEGRAFDHTLCEALEGVATRREPSADFKGAYEIVPALRQSVRGALMEMVTSQGAEAALAAECLTTIDELRDEHGAAAGETRHPNIQSGRPWPIV
jgi:hypothetical protein